jgi:ATP-dependent Lon protease
MASTSVYSVRIDTRVRKMIEEMPNQDLQEEIRALIEQSVKKRRKDYLLSRARENTGTLITGMPAVQAVREDRDAR